MLGFVTVECFNLWLSCRGTGHRVWTCKAACILVDFTVLCMGVGRGVVMALKPVRAKQARRPEPITEVL